MLDESPGKRPLVPSLHLESAAGSGASRSARDSLPTSSPTGSSPGSARSDHSVDSEADCYGIDVVWAKLQGSPWWPALWLDLESIQDEELRTSLDKDRPRSGRVNRQYFLVQFFGSDQDRDSEIANMYLPCWVEQKVIRFEAGSDHNAQKVRNFSSKWRKKGLTAVQEAQSFLNGEIEAGGFTFNSPERHGDSPSRGHSGGDNATSSSDDESEVFNVEQIVGKRTMDDGQTEYLVKWLGFDDSENTWEPIESCGDCQVRARPALRSVCTTVCPDTIGIAPAAQGLIKSFERRQREGSPAGAPRASTGEDGSRCARCD